MRKQTILFGRGALLALFALSLCNFGMGQETLDGVPAWIWSPQHRAGHVPASTCYFRKTLSLARVNRAMLAVAADDYYELYFNGRRIAEGTAKQGVLTFDVTDRVRQGDNTIAVKVDNQEGSTAGLAVRLEVLNPQNGSNLFVTDETWKTSLSPSLLWTKTIFFDARWRPATQFGPFSTFLTNQQANLSRAAASGSDRQQTPPVAVRDVAGELNAARDLKKLPSSADHLDVPREFALEQIAGHADVGSITAITLATDGSLIAAREDGQLWMLLDRDNDQQLDAVRNLGRLTKTCQGLLAVSDAVYVTGLADQGLGLYRLTDSDGDGRLDSITQIVSFQGDNVEHGPHGIVLGPDGLLYVMVGNHSPLEIRDETTGAYRNGYEGDLLSPRFEDPSGHANGIKAPGGYVLRTDTEGRHVEIVAGGLRNAYDLAFNRAGQLFTHDSDMESDLGTTWYRPTRVYQVVEGGEYGWRSGWSKWPDYYLDALPGIADTGRGSPTGIVAYDHDAFPPAYRQAIFSCDWSEGRIWVLRGDPQSAKPQVEAEVFIQGKPLNVTDIEVGPQGELYVATGGRGTAGNIYKVTWKGYQQAAVPADSEIDQALRQPQIHSAWARQRIAQVQQQLGKKWSESIEAAARETTREESERVQALQIMQWMGPPPSTELLCTLANDSSAAVRRHATYLLGLSDDAEAHEKLDLLVADQDTLVRRYACDGLARHGASAELARLAVLLVSSDRFEAWAARRVLESMPTSVWEDQLLRSQHPRLFIQGATALLLASSNEATTAGILQGCNDWMSTFIGDDDFVDLLRIQQLAIIRRNLSAEQLSDLRKSLTEEYPSSSATINRELIRLLVSLQADSIVDRYVAELDNEWPDAEKLHLAMHLTFLKSGWQTSQKMAVLRYLTAAAGGGNSVGGYVQNAALFFGEQLTESERAMAMENGQQNPGAALVALVRSPERLSPDQIEQLERLDRQIAGQPSEPIRRLQIAIIAVLARDGSPLASQYLREIYDQDPTRRAEVAVGLAETLEEENWPYLVRSLPLLESHDARRILTKLKGVRKWPTDAAAYRQVILTAQELGENGADDAIALLEHWQGFAPRANPVPWKSAVEAWKRWFAEEYPDEPTPELIVTSLNGKWDAHALMKHLARAEQERSGSVENGRSVFVKAQCAKCHRLGSQGETMGPELTTLRKRFLRREALESLLYPSKVISDQYASKLVITTDGKSYSGIVAEGADNELMILQSDGNKVRLPKEEVDTLEPSGLSAMPEGLLDGLTLDEITDLFAYLFDDAPPVASAKVPNVKR